MEQTRMLWVRHGESQANLAAPSVCRDLDSPLTDRGRRQAERTALHLALCPGLAGCLVVVSPLVRAVSTAQIIAREIKSSPPLVDEGLREIDAGELDQRPMAVTRPVREDFKQAWARGDLDARLPGGESLREVLTRAAGAFERAVRLAGGGPVVVVGHGGTFAVCASLLFADPAVPIETRMANGALSEARAWVDDGLLAGRMVSWNRRDHLSGDTETPVGGRSTRLL
jgi:broad specificity phosphatase PhoE